MGFDLQIQVPGHLTHKYLVLREIGINKGVFYDIGIILAQCIEQPDSSRYQKEDGKQLDSFPELKSISLRCLFWPFPEYTVFQNSSIIFCLQAAALLVQLLQQSYQLL